MAVKVTQKGNVMVCTEGARFIGEGKLTDEQLKLVNEWSAALEAMRVNRPDDLPVEAEDSFVVHDYKVKYRDNATGAESEMIIGGCSIRHAWEEAAYCVSDELDSFDAVILSIHFDNQVDA